nr:coatomer subunit beta'-3 isoform X5 [Arachis hypogaea]
MVHEIPNLCSTLRLYGVVELCGCHPSFSSRRRPFGSPPQCAKPLLPPPRIATEMQSKSKWKQMGELAMYNGRLDMAEDCLNHVMDLSELLPLYASLGEAEEAEGISKFVFLASCKKIR